MKRLFYNNLQIVVDTVVCICSTTHIGRADTEVKAKPVSRAGSTIRRSDNNTKRPLWSAQARHRTTDSPDLRQGYRIEEVAPIKQEMEMIDCRDQIQASIDKKRAVKHAEANGTVADSMDVRRALMAQVHAGEITLETAQQQLKKIQRNAINNGKVTRSQVFREA